MSIKDLFTELARLEEKMDTKWPVPFDIDGLRLVCTSIACPEQYDVFEESGKKVGYLRLRHGRFRADYPECFGETVYESFTKGDGTFSEDEREEELKKAISAIKIRLNSS